MVKSAILYESLIIYLDNLFKLNAVKLVTE